MAGFVFVCLFSSVIFAVHCSPVANQSLVSLDQTALSALLIPFREALLQRVAVDWNHTLTDNQRLQSDMLVCSDQIKATVRKCEYCTEAACQGTETVSQVSQSPTFKDYLKFAAAIMTPFLQEPLQEIGDKLGDLKDLLGEGSYAFIDSMAALGKTVGKKFTGAFNTIESAFNSFGGSITDISNTAIGGIKDVAGSVGDGFSNLGHNILHGIGELFGRRQTSLDPHIRECMQQCASCDALLLPTRRQLVTNVCGADVVKFNDTMRSTVSTIKSIYTAIADKPHPIILDLKYDPASANGIIIGRIYVTANVMGRYVTYQSSVKYNMVNIGITAQELALEYWTKWTV